MRLKGMALPRIRVGNRPLRLVAAEALDALQQANDPPVLFVRGGDLVRVRRDENGRPRIERVGETLLRHRLSRVSEFVGLSWRERRPKVPPLQVVQDILAFEEWPFPPVDALVEVPVLRRNGTIIAAPGYDATMRLLYAPRPGLAVPPVPKTPKRDQVRAALESLTDILRDFPFTSDAGRANALGLLLTPILRPAILGQVPLALIDKPKRGTGATLLAQVVTAIAFGSATDLMTAPRDEAEWRKTITAALLAGASMMFFDNVEHPLSSSALAAALTSPVWNDRILGRSQMARDLPQRATWMATGNNLRVGGDLSRRCYWIRLDACSARPWQRHGFRHTNLLRHVLRHRGQLVAAALTLGRAWFAAGRPKAEVPMLGGFTEWTETIGGVLDHAGVRGFLGNLGNLYEQIDEDEVSWENFLSAWHVTYGEQPRTVAEVAAELGHNGKGLPHAAIPDDLADALGLHEDGKGSFVKRLGQALRKHQGAIFGPFRVEHAGMAHHARRWRVVRVTEGS
jgi:hypothetical protein